MALPPGITPKTVTLGIASFADGSLASGRATISLNVNVIHTPTNRPIFSSEMTKPFVDGEVSFDLLPTDAPGLNRVDWSYKLKVEIQGANVQPEVIYFLLPTAGPDVVDLDGLVTVPSSAGIPISVDVLTAGDIDPTLASVITPGGSATAAALAADPALRAASGSQAADPASPLRVELGKAYVAGPRLPDDRNYRQFPVVMMHDFSSLLAAQGMMKDFKAWGYETIFYSQMMEYLRTGDATGLPEKPVVITVDDGGLSNYTYLFPALTEFGMKATYFIVPAWINGDETAPPNGGTFMEASAFTWANAQEMQAAGRVEFQSHTLTHGSMRLLSGAGTFSASEDGSGAGADFLAAKAMIETNIPGANVQYNAAPYGVINETAIASLKAAGCKGNRITQCGRGFDGNYDGSGPTAFTLPSTDPFRVPIASAGTFKSIQRANVYGTADPDGNRIQNGKFLVTSRGFTLPGGWTLPTVTLPDGTTGPALRGFGTAAATGAYHTDLIPVGYYSNYMLDFYVKATSTPTSAARVVLDCYDTPGGTLVKTIADPPGQTSVTNWLRMRWNILGDGTYAWVRPRFEVPGATASSEMLVWDARLRVQRNPLEPGSWRPIF